MSYAAFWMDPAFDNTDLLVDLVDQHPHTALSVLANPNLTSAHLDRILPKLRWSSADVNDVGAVTILAPWDEEDQDRIIRAALKTSKAAGTTLLGAARIGTRLRLWRAAQTGNFAGATELRRCLPDMMIHPWWTYLADDPHYLPSIEAMWDHFFDIAADHPLIRGGMLAGRYVLGATTDDQHERLVEMLQHVTAPHADISNLLAATHGEPERVLWWAERCELGAVLAAADPRVDAAARATLREPTNERLADMFRMYVTQYDQGRPGVDTAAFTEAKDALAAQIRRMMDTDDTDDFRSELYDWLPEVETLIRDSRTAGRMPAQHDLDWLLEPRHPAAGLVALDIVAARADYEHPHYTTALSKINAVQLKPAVRDDLRVDAVPPALMPPEYLRSPERNAWEPQYVDGDTVMQSWTATMAHRGPLGTPQHYPVARYAAGRLTTASQLYEFRRKTIGIRPSQPRVLSELVDEVLAALPAPAQRQRAEDAFSAVLGDALGSL